MLSDAQPPFRSVLKQVAFEPDYRQVGGSDETKNASSPAPTPSAQEALSQHKEKMLQEAQSEAEHILTKARQQASQMLSEAEERVNTLTREAQEQGRAQGVAAGRAELQQALHQLKSLFEETHQTREALLAGAEQEVVHLVLEIVRRLLKIEPIINEQVLVRITRHALERLGQKLEVIIQVHPEDVELLHFSLSQIEDLALDIVIEPVADIHIGSCRVHSKAGRIDADLNTQFDTVAQSFLARVEGDQHG